MKSKAMVTLHPYLADFYTGVHGGPIDRPRSAERVVTLYTVSVLR